MDRKTASLNSVIGFMRTKDSMKKYLKKDISRYNLNVTEFAVLEILFNKGKQPIQQISKKILISSGSTTYVVDQLVQKGLMKKNVSSKDKRITYASLTSKGEALMKEIFPKHENTIVELFSCLDDNELNNFQQSLKKISNKLEELEI